MTMLAAMMPWKVRRNVTLYDYQQKGSDEIREGFKQFSKQLLTLPTGAGKTVLAGEIIACFIEKRQRCLVLAHTQKLVLQFRDSLEKHYGLAVGVEMGGRKSWDEPVICATYQTMAKRVKGGKFPEDLFHLIVVDEAHRSLADSYSFLSGHFKKAKILGITATPRRTDQKDLMKFYENMVEPVSLFELIKQGHLSNITWKNIPIHIRLEDNNRADFSDEEIGHALDPYIPKCMEIYAEEAHGKCGLIFLPLIATSQKATSILVDLGVRAEHVDGTMGEREVADAIRRLELGKTEVLTCSLILTEGVDIRPVNCIMGLRPTKSWTLFVQQVGRGTRNFDPILHGPKGTIWPPKEDLLFLDPLWLCDKHHLIKRPPCLLAQDEKDEEALEGKMIAGMDLLQAQQAHLSDKEEKLAEELARLAKRKARLASAMEVFEGDAQGAQYEPLSRWQKEKVTPGQWTVLHQHGIDPESILDKGHASLVIGRIIQRSKMGLAPMPQAHEAFKLGMYGALTRKKEDVQQFLRLHRQGVDPYSGLPP